MKKVIKMYTVYRYEELSTEAKENVKDFLKERKEPYFFEDMIEEDLHNLFGDNELKVQYSLGYCQGDGLNIYGSINAKNIIDYLERERKELLTEKEKRTILYYQEYLSDIELPYNNRYCYSVSDGLELVDDWICELEYQRFRGINEDVISKFENIVKDLFSGLNEDYKKWGYDYFYEISEEDAQEECKENDYWFASDGSLFIA